MEPRENGTRIVTRERGTLIVVTVCSRQCALASRKGVRGIEGPNARDLSVLCSPFILSGSPNESWLQTCDACLITAWRLTLRAPLVARNYFIIIHKEKTKEINV